MKTILHPPFSIFALLALCATLTGCAASPLLTKSQDVVTLTNTVHAVAVVTNNSGVPVFLTNLVTETRLVTNDVFTLAPQIETYAATARTLGATITTAVPTAAPVVTALDALLGLGLAGLALFARIKTNLARQHATDLDKTNDMLTAVISGVEVAGSDTVKTAITEHSSVLGVTQALDSVVQAVTANLPGRKP